MAQINAEQLNSDDAFLEAGYHLHYIYIDREARKKEVGRDLEPDWGYVSSTDMVHWTMHPTVLGFHTVSQPAMNRN